VNGWVSKAKAKESTRNCVTLINCEQSIHVGDPKEVNGAHQDSTKKETSRFQAISRGKLLDGKNEFPINFFHHAIFEL
jgi:hypothetical protein